MRSLSRIAAIALLCAVSLTPAGSSGKMLNLTLVQRNGTIRVAAVDVIAGTPRGRAPHTGPRYRILNDSGCMSAAGAIPAPPVHHYDYVDDSGVLRGGTVECDSVIWFVRIPVSPRDHRLDFFPPAPPVVPGNDSVLPPPPFDDNASIGGCILPEVTP